MVPSITPDPYSIEISLELPSLAMVIFATPGRATEPPYAYGLAARLTAPLRLPYWVCYHRRRWTSVQQLTLTGRAVHPHALRLSRPARRCRAHTHAPAARASAYMGHHTCREKTTLYDELSAPLVRRLRARARRAASAATPCLARCLHPSPPSLPCSSLHAHPSGGRLDARPATAGALGRTARSS
jgi:hypothetical protein